MQDERNKFQQKAVEFDVPANTALMLEEWVFDGLIPGGFLMAVLNNDLMNAVGRADSYNRKCLVQITSFVYNVCPMHCWGNSDKTDDWSGLVDLYNKV